MVQTPFCPLVWIDTTEYASWTAKIPYSAKGILQFHFPTICHLVVVQFESSASLGPSGDLARVFSHMGTLEMLIEHALHILSAP